MKQGTQEVKSKIDGNQMVVGTASYTIYDSLHEARDDIGEEKIILLVNSQSRTDAMNKVRALSRPGGISKKTLYNKAVAWLCSNALDELIACGGNEMKIQTLVESKMDMIKDQLATEIGAAAVEEEASTLEPDEAPVV